MDKKKIIFFRNDDVGLYSNEPVSSELINLTNVFIDENVPISHGVVPALVSEDTVKWLNQIKMQYPNLIGIDQHGYKHVKHDIGEFGGKRRYEEQKDDITAGMELMQKFFGTNFSNCFSAPWVRYNSDTKKICDEHGIRVFSGGVSPMFYACIFNYVGRFCNLNVMCGKEVSFHRRNSFKQRGFNLLEISVGVDVIQNYELKLVKPIDLILSRYEYCKKHFDVIGFVLHQWVFDSVQNLSVMKSLLHEFKKDVDISFELLENIAQKGDQ